MSKEERCPNMSKIYCYKGITIFPVIAENSSFVKIKLIDMGITKAKHKF